jgi:hypothetical protein
VNAFEVFVEQTDEKITDLKEYLSTGRVNTFEEYKGICGEIKGLLIARGYALDLQQKLEFADD